MASKLTPYYPPPPIQSALLKKIPDSIPATSDLRALQEELEELKKMGLARSRKAGEDMKAIEESMRRMKEREKGKAKALDKIKRERDFTPGLDADDTKSIHSLHGITPKSRLSSHPIPSLPGSNRGSVDPRRPSVDDLKRKKKRKLNIEDSDVERDQRPRKSPPLAHAPPHPPLLKAQKSIPSSSQPYVKPPPGPDFNLPLSHPLLPPRPPIPPAPIPGPSKTTDVTDDFSKLKQPTQITINTFYTSIEPWIRNIREEDVGFLEYTGDEVEPYVMPKLGRHYLDVWEDQDGGLVPPLIAGQTSGVHADPQAFEAPVAKWDPSTLGDGDLLGEERGHGPLTERVVSALLPLQDQNWKGVKAAEDAMEGRPGGSGAAAARKERLNVMELEARIRDTMRFHGLLDHLPDFSEKVDDPIATALRHAQRELRTVVATNKARKQRLVSIALDRLGYQEYLEGRDSIDRNITAVYAKLQKKDSPKNAKKKKQKVLHDAAASDSNHHHNQHPHDPNNHSNGSGTSHGSTSVPPSMLVPCPAALGLYPDDELTLHVSEQLQQLVQTRRLWVDTVGAVFEEKQRQQPGRIWGLPVESVYMGIEEEVRAALMEVQEQEAKVAAVAAAAAAGGSSSSSSGKGKTVGDVQVEVPPDKGKAPEERGDEMDVG